jgi:hypothetical protein
MPRRLSSSCRQFRQQHAEFMDGLLPEGTVRAMRMHRDVCQACSQHEVLIRRSLLALQALPQIAPSADFRARLQARIANDDGNMPPVGPRGVRWGIAGSVIAASVALLLVASSRQRPATPMRLMPVLAQSQNVPSVTASGRAPQLTVMAADSAPRFESLAATSTLRGAPVTTRRPTIRLQLASYPGQ